MLGNPGNDPLDASRTVSHAIVPTGPGESFAHELATLPDEALLAPRSESATGAPGGLSLSMFLRAKWWILGVFLLVCAVAIPAVWVFVTPQFSARASIRVSPVVSRIVFNTEDNGVVPLYTSFVNTQVSVILSSTVLQRVLDRDDVRQTKWYREPKQSLLSPRESPVERLRGALNVKPRGGTELIDVALETYDPGDAKLVVDAVVDSYKTYVDDTLRQSEIRRLETLVRERDTLQKEIDGLIATKFKLTSLLDTVDPEVYRQRKSALLDDMEAQREALQRTYALVTGDANAATDPLDHPAPETQVEPQAPDLLEAAALRRYAGDMEWRNLKADLEMARHELGVKRQGLGELHPRIRELRENETLAERRLREREEQLDRIQLVSTPALATTATFASARIDADVGDAERLAQQIDLLNADIDRARTGLTDAAEIAKEVAHYDEELRYKRELYERVRQRLTAFEVESKAPARIAIADYAVKPWGPSRDRRVLLTAVAIMGAMMLGLGVGFLRSTVDPRIHDASDVYAPIQVPFLGKLPLLPNGPALGDDTEPVMAEGIRMIRTALLQRLGASGSKVVLITSSTSRAGKTSVAILLARSLAQLGKKTLLVETDLRRPSIGERMDLAADSGLAAVLAGTLDDEQAFVSTDVAHLDVLPAGSRPARFNFELLADGAFSARLKRWRESYEFIVLDSPPVFPVADARILAREADGTVMVLRSAHCRRADAFQAYTDLLAGGGKLAGTVFIGGHSDMGYGEYAEGRLYVETA